MLIFITTMKHYIVLCSAILMLSACSYEKALYVHTANKVFSPGIKDSGDIKVDGSVKLQALDKKSNGSPVSCSADVAWSPVDHLGIFGSYRGVNHKGANHDRFYGGLLNNNNIERQTFDLNGYAGDMGLGYYCRAGNTGKFEAYGGFGLGNLFNSSDDIDPGYYKVTYHRFFTQVGYGYDYDIISFMAGFRLSLEKMNSFVDHGNIATYGPGAIYDIVNTTRPYIDPYMQLQIGGKHIKLTMQLGYDISAYPHPAGVLYRPSAGYITMGIVYQRRPPVQPSQPVSE